MSFALLAKVTGIVGTASTALYSFVHYNFRDSKSEEYSEKIKSKEEIAKQLEEQKATLKSQLGFARRDIELSIICKSGKKEIKHKLDWQSRSVILKCDESGEKLK